MVKPFAKQSKGIGATFTLATALRNADGTLTEVTALRARATVHPNWAFRDREGTCKLRLQRGTRLKSAELCQRAGFPVCAAVLLAAAAYRSDSPQREPVCFHLRE